MSSTYRDSAKKLDNLFDDFMKKVNTQPQTSSQAQQLQQSASQGSGTQNIGQYLNSSSPYNGTELPSTDNRSLQHSNSAFQLYSQHTGASSNGFQGQPPQPWKQNTNPSQQNRRNSLNQYNQQNKQISQNNQQVMKDNFENQENLFELEDNNQYFHDTFQNIGSKDSVAQDSLQLTNMNTQQPSNVHHQLSFNQKSIDGGENVNNRASWEIVSRADELFPSVHQIIRSSNHHNQENNSLSSNINNIQNYMPDNPSNLGRMFNQQNSKQNLVFESNQFTYGSQMTSKRQATEGSLMVGYGTSVSTTQRESKAYANAMRALQAKIRELQSQLDSKDKEMINERQHHQDNIFNMQTIINEREEELRECRRDYEESDKQRKEMQLAFESGDAEKTEIFERMESDLSLLNTQLNESRIKQSKLKEELLSEKSARQTLEEDLLQIQQENQETKRCLHQLQAEHRLLIDDKEELNRKYQSEKMAKEEFQIKSESRQRDLQKMKEHYNEQLREFQNELNLLETNYSRKISDLEKRISLLQEENEEQKHLLDVKNTEIDQLQTSLYQKQSEWEDVRVNLLAKQRKLVDQIHSLKQQKASSTISSSSSRRNLKDHNDEDILLSSTKSRSHKKSSDNLQGNKKSRNSSASRSPTPQKSNKNLPSFSHTTIAANNQRQNIANNNFNNEQSQTSTKRSNNFNETAQTSTKSNNFSDIAQASSKNYSQNIQKSPISQSKAITTSKITKQQVFNDSSQVTQINSSSMRSTSQSPRPQSRSPNHISPISRGHSQTLPSNPQFQHHQIPQQQSQEGTARVGILNQNNFDTPLFQNELLRDRSVVDITQQVGVNSLDYDYHQNTQEQIQQQQTIGQSTITQNDFENDDKTGVTGQNNDSFFYNQYVQGVTSTNYNPNNQFNNNSNIINNSRLNVSQLQNYSQIDQSQLNQSNNNNNISYMQSQNTTTNQNTNISTTQGQDTNDKYEYILKQIIEAEKESISLSSQFQNILNESGKTEDSKKKHEYRGRLIELNEQINKNNQKLFALKRKEQEFLDQMNGNF